MNRIVLAAAALLVMAAPASAQYRGDYYRDYYDDRGYGGWYEGGRGGPYGRRGYDPYDDDDDWRRRPRRYEPRYEGRSERSRGGSGDVCVTAGGTCPHPPVPVGTACGCATSRGTFHGSVR
jgi:hypothetical protein